jgi:hypothetical protein
VPDSCETRLSAGAQDEAELVLLLLLALLMRSAKSRVFLVPMLVLLL